MLKRSAGHYATGAPLRAKFWLALVGCVVALLLSEGLLHLFWSNPWAGILAERLLTLRLHPPGVTRDVDRSVIVPSDPVVRFRTDERSYILPSRPFDDPDFTVAFLGGSTTECWIVQEPLRFPALVSELMRPHGFKVNTLNAGRSGNTLHDALLVFINHVVEDRPDVVVVMHASNDVALGAVPGSYGPREGAPVGTMAVVRYLLQMASARSWTAGFGREMWTRWSASNRRTDYSRVDAGARGFALGPYNARLRAFVRTARAFGIEPILMTEPVSSVQNALTPQWAEAGAIAIFNGVIRDVARDESVALIDLAQLIAAVPGWDQPMNVFYDGVHVTDAGSRVYAGFIADALASTLTSLRDRRRAQGIQPG